MATKTAEKTAAQTYADRRADVEAIIAAIQMELDADEMHRVLAKFATYGQQPDAS